MRICLVGSGGREHALAAVLSRSAQVMVTPGNPGMDQPTASSISRSGAMLPDSGEGSELSVASDVSTTAAPAEEIDADLFVIGPEVPLVDGLADRLRARGKRVFGPGADGARLEGSKAWMKAMLAESGVPTAAYAEFDSFAPARDHLRSQPGPYVIKTDGLAAGKGVLVTDSLTEALADTQAKLAGLSFGRAGHRVVIEQALTGPEVSVLALCDGHNAVALAPAQDFKRVGDGGTGPNTGGMGAYSPVPGAGPDVVDQVMDRAVEPMLAGLIRHGIDYRGVLYAGIMLTEDGPKVVEFNVRFGDPEAQVVLPRIRSDLAQLLAEAADGSLTSAVKFGPQSAVTVVLAAAGYPESPRLGDVICGLANAEAIEGVTVFHAGTSRDEEGRLVTNGGRVLDVTAVGADLTEARNRAYQAVGLISWPGCHYRSDIAWEAATAGATTTGP